MTTPLRSATPHRAREESVALGPLETRLLTILDRADDISSWSDDLELGAVTWLERYHLAPQRGNVLRFVPTPPEPTILEIGARCGGLTRYLGELGGVVDALEPDPAMAHVARARCADLDAVTIFDGTIADVPAEPAYDLVVLVDVVDQLDGQGLALDDVIARCTAALKPGGLLVVAADNLDGVRALAGDAPPPIGRPAGTPLRRLLRAEVEKAVEKAGLPSRSLHAFPDHRHTKVLYDHDDLTAVDPRLLVELPAFPSPPHGPRVMPFPEAELWEDAVADGTATDHSNSIVVVAGHAVPARDTAAAAYWTMGRAAAQSAVNRIIVRDGDVVVDRSLAFPSAGPAQGPLRLRPHTETFVRGRSMVDVLVTTDSLDHATSLLRAWRDLVGRACQDAATIPWDLIPRNIVVTDDGRVVPIDQEWELDGGDETVVLSRGSFWLAHDLLITHPQPAWMPPATVATGARLIASLSGSGLPDDWMDPFIERESGHMADVWPASERFSRRGRARKEWHNLTDLSNQARLDPPTQDPTGDDASEASRDVIEALATSNAALQQRVTALELELRHAALVHRDHAIGLMATAETFRRRHQIAEKAVSDARAKATRAQKRVRAMRASSTWRIGSFFTRPMARLRGK